MKDVSYIKNDHEYNDIMEIHRKISLLLKNNIYLYADYIAATDNIIEEYNKNIKIPIKKSFIKKDNKIHDNNTIIQNIIHKYMKTISLLNLDIDYAKEVISKFQNRKKNSYVINSYKDCDCSELITYDNLNYCKKCGILNTNSENNFDNMCFIDKDRINMNQKFEYTHKTHFLETLDQISGKQNKTISPKVFQDLEKKFKEHDFRIDKNGLYPKLTKEHIHIFLSETGNSRSYEDENYLYRFYTGIELPSFDGIKDKLIEDFEQVVEGFKILKKTDPSLKRVSFLNINYIIIQLLKKNSYYMNIDQFVRQLKTLDRQQEHRDLYNRISSIINFPIPSNSTNN